VELDGRGVILQPRLGLNDGFIRVYQPATDRYAAYSYDWDQDITTLDYGTNTTEPVLVKVLKLRSERVSQVTVDGRPAEFKAETIGRDTYTAFTAPTGQHHIEIIKGQPVIQTAAVAVNSTPAILASPTPVAQPTPTPALAAARVEPATTAVTAGSGQTVDPSPAKPQPIATLSLAAKNARAGRQAVLQFISAGLIVLMSLLLLVLVALRRVAGWNHQPVAVVRQHAPQRAKTRSKK